MNRRRFIKNTGLSIPLTALLSFKLEDFDLSEASIDKLQQEMEYGSETSRSITQHYLKRISDLDKKGPKLNAIIELNPDAITIADKMDDERKAGKVRGPLHGIPVLIKDNIDTADKMMTTAGSLALLGNKASEDAFIVKQLRQAGAVILGKTNLSEWSNFRSSHSASGWSSRGGLTRNPNVLDRDASGSSSGSCVAVAANLCAIAIGTETNGSIISPSSMNGIVGIKPTVGLLSRKGIIPISKTQDTAGPLARTVKDAAILLGILAGKDANDEATLQVTFEKDYLKYLSKDALRGKRIGIDKSQLKSRQNVVSLFNEAIEAMKKNGAIIVEVDLLDAVGKLDVNETTILQYEFKYGLNKYLSTANSSMKSISDIIAFNKQNKEKLMPYFDQETMESSAKLGELDSDEYITAFKKRTDVQHLIDSILKSENLDAISGISTGPAGAIDLVNGDYGTGFYFCSPAAIAGYPHITVPMGKVHELPVGISFMAGALNEGKLIGIAYAYEQASHKRETPKFINTTLPA